MIGYFKMIVNGNIDLSDSNIETLGKLKEIKGFINLQVCENLKDLGELKKINGDLKISWSKINSIGNLREVQGDLDIVNCYDLTSLNKLKVVSGVVNLFKCKSLVSLGNLQLIDGEFLSVEYCKNLKNLGKLSELSGDFDIYLKFSGITKEYIEKHKPELIGRCKWQ